MTALDVRQPLSALSEAGIGSGTALTPFANRMILEQLSEDSRATTPENITQQRAFKRLSPSEFSSTNLDSIRARIAHVSSPRDTRPGYVKALDILDAPRNAVANLIFRGTVERLRREDPKDVAAGGLPRVMFSDALKSLGVENNVVRGVVGFVGDVALDPLTYLGGSGVGVRLAGKAGTSAVRIGPSGARAIRGGTRAFAKGEAVRNAEVGELLDAWAAAIRSDGKAKGVELTNDQVREAVMNAALGGFGDGKAAGIRKLADRVGIEITRQGSELPDLIRQVTNLATDTADDGLTRRMAESVASLSPERIRLIEAAKKFTSKYAASAGTASKGIKIGGGGSTLLHIPLTDIGLHVPAFTRNGREALAAATLARLSSAEPAGGEFVLRASNRLDEMVELTDRFVARANRQGDEAADAGRAADTLDFDPFGGIDDIVDEGEDIASIYNRMEELRAEMRDDIIRAEEAMIDPTPQEVAGLRQMMDIANAQVELAKTRLDGVTSGHGADGLRLALGRRREIRRRTGQRAARVDGDPGVVNMPRTGDRSPLAFLLGRYGIEMSDFKMDGRQGQVAVGTPFQQLGTDPEIMGVFENNLLYEAERLRRGGMLDEIEGVRVDSLQPGDTFTLGMRPGGAGRRYVVHSVDENGVRILADGVDPDDVFRIEDGGVVKTRLSEGRFRDEPMVLPADAGSLQRAAARADDLLDDDPLGGIDDIAREARRGPAAERIDDAYRMFDEGLIDQDELEETLVTLYAANMSEQQRDLFTLPMDELVRMEADIEAVQNQVSAAQGFADATRSSLMSVLNSRERAVVELAKFNLGLTSDVIGASIVGGMARQFREIAGRHGPETFVDSSGKVVTDASGRAVRRAPSDPVSSAANAVASGLEAADTASRNVFGVRSGSVKSVGKAGQNIQRDVAVQQSLAAVVREVKQVADMMGRKYGLKPKQYSELDEYLMILAYERRAQQSGDVFFRTKPDGTPSAMALRKAEIERSGVLNKPGIREDLEPFVDDVLESLDVAAQRSLDQGILNDGQILLSYLPLSLTRSTQRKVREFERAVPDNAFRTGRSLSEIEGTPTEPFQMSRSTTQYRFDRGDGTTAQLFDADFELWGTKTPERIVDDLARMGLGQAEIDEILRIKADVDLFNALHETPSDDLRRLAFGRATDPFELNSLKHRFRFLHGYSGYDDPIFEVGLYDVMAGRIAAQKRAEAQVQFAKMARGFGVAGPINQLQTGSYGLVGGDQRLGAYVLPPKDGSVRVRIGDIEYRTLNADIVNESPMLQSLAREGSQNMLYPTMVAEQIEGVMRASTDQALGDIAAASDKAMSVWKMTTLGHPSWVVLNIVGNISLALQGGANMASVSKHTWPAVKAVTGKFLRDENATIRVGARTLHADDLMDEALNNGVVRSRANELLDMVRQVVLRRPTKVNFQRSGMAGVGDALGGAAQDITDDVAEAMNNYALANNRARDPNFVDKAGAWLKTLAGDKTFMRLYAPFFYANSIAEDSMRLAVYMSFLDDGLSPQQAAEKLSRTMFDYADLTRVEQNVRRFVAPFYSWIRHNMGYQIHQLLERPREAASLPKLKAAIEETLVGEETVPEHARPRWMQNQFMVQLSRDPDSRFALALATFLPQADTLNLGQGVTGGEGLMDAAGFLVGSVNPFAQAAISIGQGRETFSGRTIAAEPGAGDLSLGEYALGQIRPLRELGNPASIRQGSLPAAFSRSTGEGLGRFALGGRLQSFSQDRLDSTIEGEFRDLERNIRRRWRLAEREGDEGAAIDAMARLLALYNDAVEAGQESLVPKWAREQVGMMRMERGGGGEG